ncbi:MAG: DNA polymerase III subunit beta [Micavibrio sp.]|nr:DNA polymerase III subunit beta [Micavibrio sp.]
MKLTINRSDLMRALSHVQSVVERRNTIPILANVKMEASGDALKLTTTDMDLEINESVAAKIAQEGTTTAPAQTLHDIVRKLPDGSDVEMTLEPGGSTMTVKAGRSVFKLSCLPISDFPDISSDNLDVTFTLPAADLRAIIDKTKFAMSTEETRYYLNGIYLHAIEKDGVALLCAVATDGHRLAKFEMPLPESAAGMPGIIIPRKTVGEIRKLVEDAADVISISLSASKIRFAFDHIVMTSKLIDGTFPDYQKVIPQGNDKVIELNPKAFSAAIDRVATIMTADKSRAVKLAVNGQNMVISANSPDAGSANEDVSITNDNVEMEIGFNSRYLLDITSQIEGEGCRVVLADSSSPTIIEDLADSSSLYVIMPLRV